MKTITIIFTLFLLSHSFSQDKYINRGKCLSKNFISEVPYEWVNQKLIIDVEIDGKIYKFLFDTGAPNMIAEEILKDVDHKPLKSIKVKDINNDSERMKMVSIKKLKLGTAEYANSTAIAVKRNENFVFTCFEIDGIIGSNLCRNSIVKIDSDNKKLIFTDKIEKLELQDNQAYPLEFKDNQSSPFLKIHLLGDNGKKGQEYAMFDSGMGGLFDLAVRNFGVYQKDTLFHNFWSGTGSSSIGLFASTNKQSEFKVLVPVLTLGDGHLKNLTTITTVSSHSRFGAEILKYCSLTLDYKNNNFYFNWKSDTTDVTELEYDFTPTLYEGKMAVGSVWTKELSEKLEYGDLILKFNEIDISNINLCDLITQTSIFRKWKEADITFKKKDGVVLKMHLVKKVLRAKDLN